MKSFVFLSLASLALATKTYTWSVSRMNASPDGTSRSVIGINGEWPCPTVEADVGEQIIVHLTNNLDGEDTSLHFHGFLQQGTPEMDGPVAATQCPIPPGSNFTYSFVASKPGTYWYHDHSGKYPDGFRGPVVIHDSGNPYAGQYDEEIVVSVSDWYHAQSADLIAQQLSPSNVNILPPFPDSSLVNDQQNTKISVQAGKTYFVRVVSMSAFAPTFLKIDGHSMDIIEVDGVYTEINTVDLIHVAPAQRYGFLLHTKNSSSTNYAILAALDVNRDFTAGGVYPTNTSAFLMYNDGDVPAPLVVDSWSSVLDDMTLVPADGQAALPSADATYNIDFTFGFDEDGVPRAYFNNVTYVQQIVPTLYSALTVGSYSDDVRVYGQVNPFIAEEGQVVDIIVNNLEPATHPFHLHGHTFQVIERPPSGSGVYSGGGATASVPLRRDTVGINANSYAVLRFTADNPGTWLFHCHIEWHVAMGMTATIIEAPEKLPSIVTIPPDHLLACAVDQLPTAGNAAGNVVDVLDLTGANTDNSTAVEQKRSVLRKLAKKYSRFGRRSGGPTKPWVGTH